MMRQLIGVFDDAEAAAAPTVAANDADHIRPRFNAGTAYSIVEFDSDGSENANSNAISPTLTDGLRGTWLTTGTGAEVWIERTINSGSFNHTDSGPGRLQLNFSRKFGVSQTGNGTTTCDVTFDFYDAASGGNLLDTVTILIRAIVSTL